MAAKPLLVPLIERKHPCEDGGNGAAVRMPALLGELEPQVAGALGLLLLSEQRERVSEAGQADDLGILAVAHQVGGALLWVAARDRVLEVRARRRSLPCQ